MLPCSARFFLILVANLVLTPFYMVAQDLNQTPESNSSAEKSSIKPGRILGRVFDADSGEALKDVTVVLEDQDRETKTDLEGRYRLSEIAPGDYSLLFFKENYQRTRVKVEGVASGRSKLIDLPLNPDYSNLETLDAFEITAEDLAGSDIQLLALRQESMVVMDAMGSFDMSRLGAGNVADALTKMVGTSVQDGKYVVVRGLADRYSNATFNGVPIPSSDVYRNTPQLDLFPSIAVDSISIKKSFSPELNPAFSGGSVDVVTKAYPEEFSLSVSIGTSFDEFTHGEGQYLTYSGSNSDWLGFGLDDRKLPDNYMSVHNKTGGLLKGVGSTSISNSIAEELNNFHSDLSKEMVPFYDEPDPDSNIGVQYGDLFELDDFSLGVMASFDFSKSTSGVSDYYDIEPYSWDPEGNPNYIFWKSFNIEKGSELAELGGFSQIVFLPDEENELGLISLYSHTGEKKSSYGRSLERGLNNERLESDSGSGGAKVDIFELAWEERDMLINQLYGKHKLGFLNNWELDWRFAKTDVSLDEPDRRSLQRAWKMDEDSGEWKYFGPSRKNSGGDIGAQPEKIWRNLNDEATYSSFKMTSPFFDFSEQVEGKFLFGRVENDTDRLFDQSVLYLNPTLSLDNGPSLISDFGQYGFDGGLGNYNDSLMDVHNFMSDQYVGYDLADLSKSKGNVFTFLPKDAAPHDYAGSEKSQSIFLNLELSFPSDQKLSLGLRKEKLSIEVTPIPDIPIEQEFKRQNVAAQKASLKSSTEHPAISYVKNFGPEFKLSTSYGKTMAKPTYRELAYVETPDLITGRVYKGNPDLDLSFIDNFDIRFDWNPSEEEIFSFSCFYKTITDPIQQTKGAQGKSFGKLANGQDITYNQYTYTFLNSDSATLYGLELEAKSSLSRLYDFLEWFKVGGNLTWSKSELTLSDLEKALFAEPDYYKETRSLEGQSEWIFNFDFSYQNDDLGLVSTVVYSYYSDRLESAAYQFPNDIWEDAYSTLDFISSYNFGGFDDWKLKFSAKNLTAPERISRVYGNASILTKYQTPRSFGLSISKDF